MSIKEWWKAKARDKQLHFGISAILTLILSFVMAFESAILIVLIVGFAKEVIDWAFGGRFSVPDLLADIAGILSGTVVYTVIMKVMEVL